MSSLELLKTTTVETGPAGDELDALRDCDGFRVVSSAGYVGTVDTVLYGAARRPAALAIRTGLFTQRLVLVPVENVLSVSTSRRILELGKSWYPVPVDVSEAPDRD